MSQFDHEAFWSARYRDAGDDYLFGTAPNRFLEAQAALFRPGLRVLSVADGEGRNAVWLAAQGCAVTATEISPVALAKAQKLAHQQHVTVDFVETDILRWAWPQAAYDVVVGIFIQFVGPQERAQLFAAMREAVCPGGTLLLQGYTPKQLEYRTGGPGAVENLYTRELLEEAFGDWEIIQLKEHEAMIEEGRGHAGHSALIDLVVRKPAA
ncbi:MAG: class I SAM-dependent methyltransferase [Rhodocyclales bacterium]|nr:class I SAM-dependent methyltransferase [Rhodocyclales bacterium]